MVNETGGRPRLTAKGERTRARIVQEGAALIHERGVAGATLDDVKVAAEVSGSQLYHYFPDKNDLVQAALHSQRVGTGPRGMAFPCSQLASENARCSRVESGSRW